MSNNAQIRKFNFGVFTDVVQTKTGNFTGFVPDGAPTATNGRITFAEGTDQGMIDLVQFGVDTPVRVLRVMAFMAGQASWSLNLIDGSNTLVLASGTNETSYSAEAVAFLTQTQKLQFVTTGGGTTSVKWVATLIDVNQYSPSPKGV